MIGEGIKQIPSYKCTIPFDKLNELREAFWNEKFKISRRWKAIREICESDAASATQLIEAAGFFCQQDLRVIAEMENPSIIYKVPNYCITDPVFERDYQTIEEKDEAIETVPLTIKCYCFTNLKESKMQVTNRTTGKEIKEKFSVQENFPLDKYNIRLFYTGQEIKDDHVLCYHNVVDGGKIQISCANL